MSSTAGINPTETGGWAVIWSPPGIPELVPIGPQQFLVLGPRWWAGRCPSAPPRLNHSQLFVVTTRPETFEAAAKSEADVLLFELEDAVPPADKSSARGNLLEALNDIDWGSKTLSMRINGLDTPYMYRDLVEVLGGPSERLDLLLIPKAGVAADIYAVDMLVTQIEQATSRSKRLDFEIMIETALGRHVDSAESTT